MPTNMLRDGGTTPLGEEREADAPVEAVAEAPAEAAPEAPAEEPKKSHIREWWESTPIGGFMTAAGEDIREGRARRAAEGGSPEETTAEDDAAAEERRERRRAAREERAEREAEAGAVTAKPAAAPAPSDATPVAPEKDPADTSQFYGGVESSMGKDATEYLQKSQESARKLAEETAQTSALGAAKTALRAARTSGLSAGESALASGQVGADAYSGTYGAEVGRGMDRYSGATSQFGALAGQRAGELLQKYGIQMGSKASERQADLAEQQQKQQNLMGWLGAAATGLTALLSDENTKKNIVPTTSVETVLAKLKGAPSNATTVEAVLAKVRPVKFDYKGEQDGSNRVGVIAQQLEETPLKEVVKDTPEGKVIDSAQLTGGNTAMILELAQMLVDMRKELKAMKGQTNG